MHASESSPPEVFWAAGAIPHAGPAAPTPCQRWAVAAPPLEPPFPSSLPTPLGFQASSLPLPPFLTIDALLCSAEEYAVTSFTSHPEPRPSPSPAL